MTLQQVDVILKTDKYKEGFQWKGREEYLVRSDFSEDKIEKKNMHTKEFLDKQ